MPNVCHYALLTLCTMYSAINNMPLRPLLLPSLEFLVTKVPQDVGAGLLVRFDQVINDTVVTSPLRLDLWHPPLRDHRRDLANDGPVQSPSCKS